MARSGSFQIIDKGVRIVFHRTGETFKSVDSPAGIKSRKVIQWEATEFDPEYGEITREIYVLPRSNRAEVVEQYFNPSQGIIY